jgi:hypothetical protein
MARGNEIIVTANPKGNFTEGIIGGSETPKPGTIMQIDPSVALLGGRHSWVAYNRDADGDQPKGSFAVLLHDPYQGRTATDAYLAGDRCFLYEPVMGDELNLLFGNAAGTADDIALGDIMMVDDGTGKIIKTTGSPETEVAVALEAIVDPTADQLLWVKWSGH